MVIFEDLIIVAIFWILFMAWIFYLMLFKKNLKDHRDQIQTASFGLGVMSLIYWWICF